MRIRPEQLPAELSKRLLPVYFVCGDEPLLVQEAMDAIRAQCKVEGFDERKVLSVDRKFDWSVLADEANTLSLFAEKKITELKLGKSKPGTPGAKAIQNYFSSPPEDNILILESAKLDAATLRSKWASTIDKHGAIIQAWPISIEEMPRWLSQRAVKMGLSISRDGIALLCDRLEGNLLAAQQELEKLKLAYDDQEISTENVIDSVSDASRYDIFNLTDACLNNNGKLVVKIISHLRTEGQEPSMTLWALSKEIRLISALIVGAAQGESEQTIFKKYRVIQKRQRQLSHTARRLNTNKISIMLAQCKTIDDLIKGVQKGQSPWDALLDVSLLLAGYELQT